MAESGRVIKVAKVSKATSRTAGQKDWQVKLATLCFYYPQYTFADAYRLPAWIVNLLLKRAHQLEAERYFNLTEISTAPHTEKGKGVKQLLNRYEEIMNG